MRSVVCSRRSAEGGWGVGEPAGLSFSPHGEYRPPKIAKILTSKNHGSRFKSLKMVPLGDLFFFLVVHRRFAGFSRVSGVQIFAHFRILCVDKIAAQECTRPVVVCSRSRSDFAKKNSVVYKPEGLYWKTIAELDVM